ncbi:MAG: Smr/MutS family protein [Gammaproteobacteria bacterium]
MNADDKDRRLFRKAVADAVPIARRPAPPRPPRPKPDARFRRAAERDALAQSHDDPRDPDEFGAEPDLAYAAPGIQNRVLRRLRRGQIPEQAVLDLHGKTQAAAREELAEFLAVAGARNLTCVRVIHGKGHRSGPGGPVLKLAVARWLARRSDVLAYTSARPVDGGTGAVYVLLRSGARSAASPVDVRDRRS